MLIRIWELTLKCLLSFAYRELMQRLPKRLYGYAARCAKARQQRFGSMARPNEPRPSEPEGPGLPTEPSAAASLSNSPGQTNYPTLLAPMSPTAAEEADPESC